MVESGSETVESGSGECREGIEGTKALDHRFCNSGISSTGPMDRAGRGWLIEGVQLSRGRCLLQTSKSWGGERPDHRQLRQGVESQLQRRSGGDLPIRVRHSPGFPAPPLEAHHLQHRETCRLSDLTINSRRQILRTKSTCNHFGGSIMLSDPMVGFFAIFLSDIFPPRHPLNPLQAPGSCLVSGPPSPHDSHFPGSREGEEGLPRSPRPERGRIRVEQTPFPLAMASLLGYQLHRSRWLTSPWSAPRKCFKVVNAGCDGPGPLQSALKLQSGSPKSRPL